ncbi:MAG TPA: zinc-ribbon domain-containing protein [Terriglobales bacterium]|nr:zinc-ribbon domain-containing protein [Terriglobales bacterium]
MAFCNTCGSNLDAGAKFCSKCGTVIAEGPSASYPAAPPAPQGSNPVKMVLIVVGVLAAIAVIGTVAATLIGFTIARHTRVQTSNGAVKVQSPFGTVETTKDPEEAAKNLGVDLYPGARVLEHGAANVNVAGTHTVAANFETDDSAQQVADFYKSKFPSAKISVSDENHYSIVSMGGGRILSINVEPQDGKTMIHIANVRGNGVVDDDSKD